MDDSNKSKTPWWQAGLQLFLRLSAWIVFPIIVAVFAGGYLDNIFHTGPWLSFVAATGAFIFSIVKIVNIGLKEMDTDDTNKGKK